MPRAVIALLAASTALAAPAVRLPRALSGPRAGAIQSVVSVPRAASPAAPRLAAPAAGLSDDQIVLRGIELALNSKSQRARFGALVVAPDGRVIGEGWNRQSTKAERQLVRVGIILHAEQAALAQALANGESVEGARVYAVGASKDGLSYARKKKAGFACPVCARTMAHLHADAMSSSSRGFKRIPWSEVEAVAKAAKGKWWQGKPAAASNIRWLPVDALRARAAEKL